MGEKSIHVFIEGRVQGVWYRAWTAEQATERNLDGWVRNRHDGRVEAVFSGDTTRVDDMVAVCQSGPPLARVDTVHVEDERETVEPGFRTRSTQ